MLGLVEKESLSETIVTASFTADYSGDADGGRYELAVLRVRAAGGKGEVGGDRVGALVS
jgi:hypothetical protein